MYRLFNVLCWLWTGALECIFQNQYKTLYNLFSPDPAVFCVSNKQVSYREIHTLYSILLYFIYDSVISFFAMDAFTLDKWILIAAFLLDLQHFC